MSFDDFDDTTDDSYPQPMPVQARLGESEVILRRTIDIVATAPSMPLSSSPRIDRDEVVELLEDALVRLPDEIRQARWMLKERQEFLDKTKREADELLGAARQQAERMVQRTEVVRAAEARSSTSGEAAYRLRDSDRETRDPQAPARSIRARGRRALRCRADLNRARRSQAARRNGA